MQIFVMLKRYKLDLKWCCPARTPASRRVLCVLSKFLSQLKPQEIEGNSSIFGYMMRLLSVSRNKIYSNIIKLLINDCIFLLEGVLWFPTGNLRTNKALNLIHGFLVHFIPAIFLDLVSIATGRKPMYSLNFPYFVRYF